MPVNEFDCSKFINRGGRIPAPIHSLKIRGNSNFLIYKNIDDNKFALYNIYVTGVLYG